MSWPRTITIREVGPRDGIQSERLHVDTGDKIGFIDALSVTGILHIEAVSFVSPKALPQMADAAEVLAGITRAPGVTYSALVPNRRGADAAVEARADALQVFMAVTDSYNLKNVNKNVKESLRDVSDVVTVGQTASVPVEGTLSTAFGDPYEGDVAPERVVEVSRWMMEEGIESISYGDTTGMATPRRVRDLIAALREKLPGLRLNMHFHDTRGTGLANVLIALECGIDYFDASVGGMGGSPFASGATGNVVTEDLVHMVEDMGIDTGVDLNALLAAARIAQSFVSGDLPSRVLRAGPRDRVDSAGGAA
ncbi:MAG: hydroxymethylglutaryl-CoA lyase [Actinomycetota bacterium]|nr:hydroxymethylglutaryl-CoA lyase [Actinomycetota bacterium]